MRRCMIHGLRRLDGVLAAALSGWIVFEHGAMVQGTLGGLLIKILLQIARVAFIGIPQIGKATVRIAE